MMLFGKYLYTILLLCIFIITGFATTAQEICDNGIDDDDNNLVDLYDPGCQCRFRVTGNLLLNSSFELYDHCPASYIYENDYNIADAWLFGTYTHVNEAYYYHNFNCTYDSAQVMLNMPPVLPLPDGNAFISVKNIYSVIEQPAENEITKSYVGQCLQSSLKKGETYTLSFYAGRFRSWDNFIGKIFPFNVAVFGNKDCAAVPFGKTNALGNGCPSNYAGWILLGSTTIHSSGQWVQSKVNLNIPHDINVIEIGPDCSILPPVVDLIDSTTFLDYHMYYLDDLHLLYTKDFPFRYIHARTGPGCNGLPVLEAPVFANATYQWYKDSIAIKGATGNTYRVPGIDGINYYNVLITTSDSCFTSEPFLITASRLNEIEIPGETAICSGDTILLAQPLPGITYTVNGITSNSVLINSEGSYTIIARDVYGCERTFSTLVAKQNCEHCDAFIPTAFTPNNDGLNDLFKPKFYCAIPQFHFSIFNRWGKKIFETNNISGAWDGTYAGIKQPIGAYVYYIDYITSPGINKKVRGTITLIR